MTPENAILLAFVVCLVLLERIRALQRLRSRFLRAHFAADVALLLLGYVAVSRLAYVYVARGSAAFGAIGVPRFGAMEVPSWLEVAVALGLLDLGNYAAHRLLHASNALWEVHKVHHSSRALDWLATFRSHVLEQLLRRVVAPVLLLAVGVSMPAIGIAAAIFLGFAVFNHSNLRVDLRFLEPLFITPRLHHLHHVPERSETNFGTVFSLWDRWLGCLDTRPVARDATLGVPGEVGTYPEGFIPQLQEPLRRLLGSARGPRPLGNLRNTD